MSEIERRTTLYLIWARDTIAMYFNNLVEDILRKTDGGKTIILSVHPSWGPYFDNPKKKFRVREKDEDKTPSASLKKLTGTNRGYDFWVLRDFGADDHARDAIAIYADDNGMTYRAAVKALAEKYDLIPDRTIYVPKRDKTKATESQPEGWYHLESKTFSQKELEIWGPYVTGDVLARYGWHAVLYYSFVKDGTTHTIFSNENYPIFARDLGDGYKLYMPYSQEKKYRFSYRCKTPGGKMDMAGRICGIEQLKAAYEQLNNGKKDDEKERLKEAIICSGERDAMNLAGMGYYPIWFNSETSELTGKMMREIGKYANKIYNVPDMDETGVRQGNEKALKFLSIYTIELPLHILECYDERGNACKDFRDFCGIYPPEKNGHEKFEKLKNRAQCGQFWYYHNKTIKISTTRLLYFLHIHGFYKLPSVPGEETTFVRVHGYIVERYYARQIRDFIHQQIVDRDLEFEVLEAFLISRKAVNSVYEDLTSLDLNFKSSTPHGRYFFFENGCFEVTKNGTRQVKNPECYVWKDQIIPHVFSPLQPFFKRQESQNWELADIESPVYRYSLNCSRMYWRKEFEANASSKPEENAAYREKYHYCISGPRLFDWEKDIQYRYLINRLYCYGYLLHDFKSDKQAYAIYLLEQSVDNENVNSGGSGKSFVAKMMKKLRLLKVIDFDGRDLEQFKNPHWLDRVREGSTQLINFDDLDERVRFHTFYSMITNGIIVNKKHRDSQHLEFKDAPNIIFSSNHVPDNMDPSTLRRIRFMQFSDYYHARTNKTDKAHTISDDFGGMELFSEDYPEEYYNADYNFLLQCVQFYLLSLYNGESCESPMEETYKRMEKKKIGEPELEWFKSYIIQGDRVECFLDRQTVYDAYCSYMASYGYDTLKTGIWKVKFIECCRFYNLLYGADRLPFKQKDGRFSTKYKLTGDKKMATHEMLYVHLDGAPLNAQLHDEYNIKLKEA